jgi:pyridoxal phosphate enzyme (YggS family)
MTDRADIDIAANYARVCEQVARAALRCGRRPEEITIVCAAKTKGPEAVRAALAAGATTIGENYVQEAQHKRTAVSAPGQWHLIGHLQRNKAKTAVSLFSLIHSLDSIALARELDRQAKKQSLTVRSLVEVRLGGEATKTGLAEDDLGPLLETLQTLSHVRVEGLMTIPPPSQSARQYFRQLARLRQEYGAMEAPNISLRELSMGMTDDYALAIEEGATLVRIGRAIFGERQS